MGKEQLNELRCNSSDFETIGIDDVIVVFKGIVTLIHCYNHDEQEIKKILILLKSLCNTFYNVEHNIFDDFGQLRRKYRIGNYANIIDAVYCFNNMPKVIIGTFEEKEYGYNLNIENDSYDVTNSKELYELVTKTDLMDYVDTISVNNSIIDVSTIEKPDDIPVANPLYHGTTTKYLPSILKKGIRKIQDNSIFHASNEGFVFLTSDYNIAEDYATSYAVQKGGQMVVIEINSNLIDKDKIVLDYDFVTQFIGTNDVSPYTGTNNGYWDKHFKGIAATTTKNYGTKFSKIGYKGIIMPNAITKCHIYPKIGKSNKTYTREECIKMYNSIPTNETYTRINEVNSNDIDLSSFMIKNNLHPKFWVEKNDEYQLSSKVRLRLLDIADDFIDELSVDWVKPKDIIFTGSLANFNWSRYSDVDIHILYDFKKIYKKTEFVDDYFKAKKEVWLKNHKKLKIYGYPIEISVEDSNENNPSSGRYSLESNRWLTEPNDFQDSSLNTAYIKKFAAKIMTEIDDIEQKINNETDTHKIELLGDKVEKIFKRLKNIRNEGLNSRQKEMSSGNIIYKLIRRMKYLDKIWKIANKAYDNINSLKEKKYINI